jgi:hypothetical protein
VARMAWQVIAWCVTGIVPVVGYTLLHIKED